MRPVGKLLGEDLYETSESYWAAAKRAREAGLWEDAGSLADHARSLAKREVAQKIGGVLLFVMFVWAARNLYVNGMVF